MVTQYKEMRHTVALQPEDEGFLSREEIYAFYAHSLVYPKKEPGMIKSSLSGSSMEPRFSVGNPCLRKIAAKIIENRIRTHEIKQVAFPGVGGALTALAWAETGANINMAHMRVDKEAPSHKRLETAIEGYLLKDTPVWICDDVLTSGNGFIKSYSCLMRAGYRVGGFCPLMAHEEGSGARGAQCISMSNREFVFAPVFMLIPTPKKLRPVTEFASKNSLLFPSSY